MNNVLGYQQIAFTGKPDSNPPFSFGNAQCAATVDDGCRSGSS
ncbi:MAG: hypothetical protein R3C59_12280 [Planctomycetaceae bacterium]